MAGMRHRAGHHWQAGLWLLLLLAVGMAAGHAIEPMAGPGAPAAVAQALADNLDDLLPVTVALPAPPRPAYRRIAPRPTCAVITLPRAVFQPPKPPDDPSLPCSGRVPAAGGAFARPLVPERTECHAMPRL